MPSKTNLRTLLRRFRRNRTERECAKLLGLTLGTFRNWVQGRRKPQPIIALIIEARIQSEERAEAQRRAKAQQALTQVIYQYLKTKIRPIPNPQ